jgi:hypothetical protein
VDHKPPARSRPLVVISWHWDCDACPETQSAWFEYRQATIEAAQSAEFELAVHSHPRIANQVRSWAKANGLTWIEDFSEVLAGANLYCVDNSSTMFEFAATNRPVVVINSAHYRRSVDHGLRFWREASVGVNCNRPAHLRTSILQALTDSASQRQKRAASIERVYGGTLGHATERAVAAILEIISEERIIMSNHVIRSLASTMGYCGEIGRGWTIELYPNHCVVTDNRGRQFTRDYRPTGTINPESRAREMVATGLYEAVVTTKDAKIAPGARENKMAPRPQGNKGVQVVTADAETDDALVEAILECVRQGHGKTATKKEIGAGDAYTQDQVADAWDQLYADGVIVDGEKQWTYLVADEKA